MILLILSPQNLGVTNHSIVQTETRSSLTIAARPSIHRYLSNVHQFFTAWSPQPPVRLGLHFSFSNYLRSAGVAVQRNLSKIEHLWLSPGFLWRLCVSVPGSCMHETSNWGLRTYWQPIRRTSQRTAESTRGDGVIRYLMCQTLWNSSRLRAIHDPFTCRNN